MSDATRARVAGKMAVAARTVWQLDIGQMRIRCLWQDDHYELQARTEKGWCHFGGGTCPHQLLSRVIIGKTVAAAIERNKPAGSSPNKQKGL